MLNCIYHPTDPMRVVEDDEYKKLLSTGFWFAHPTEAKKEREKYEQRIHDEQRKNDGKRHAKEKFQKQRDVTRC